MVHGVLPFQQLTSHPFSNNQGMRHRGSDLSKLIMCLLAFSKGNDGLTDQTCSSEGPDLQDVLKKN